jgi:hypothetical protein
MRLREQVDASERWLKHTSSASCLEDWLASADAMVTDSIAENTERIMQRHGWGLDQAVSWSVLLPFYSANWASFGFNVFKITHGLTSLLLLTDVERGAVDLPFPAFQIDLPGNFVPSARVPGAFIERIVVHQYESQGVRHLWWMLYLSEGGVYPYKRHMAVIDDPTPIEAGGTEGGNRDAATTIHILRTLGSFLACRTEVPVLENAKAVARAEAKGVSTARVFVAGRTVKIRPEIMRAVATAASDGAPLWKLQHRHVVRGHWRNQACGPRLSERRKTWIEPYWKGPEGAEAWRHVYEC